MAIEINKPGNNKVNPPTIVLTGNLFNADTGSIGGGTSITIGSQKIIQDGIIVDNRDEIVFSEKIVIELTPDPAFDANSYVNIKPYNEYSKTANLVQGKKALEGRNEKSDTYYSLNGKNPVRTKSSLYTAPFTIKKNTSGDNIVLKTRTYVQGFRSEVRRVDLRIINKSSKEI